MRLIAAPAMLKYQKASGTTLLRARSLLIHCTMKRMKNMPWPMKPTAAQICSAVIACSLRSEWLRSIAALDDGIARPPHQPIDPGEVDDPGGEAVAQPVFRDPRQARAVRDLEKGDCATVALDESGQEAVIVVEARQTQIGVAAAELEAAARVGRAVLEHGAAHPVGNPRGEALEPGVAATAADAGDHAQIGRRRVLQALDEARDIGGIVLAVAVEHDEPFALGGVDGARQGHALTPIVAVAHDAQIDVAPLGRGQPLWRAIGAGVVAIDDLEGGAQALHDGIELLDHRIDIVLFV